MRQHLTQLQPMFTTTMQKAKQKLNNIFALVVHLLSVDDSGSELTVESVCLQFSVPVGEVSVGISMTKLTLSRLFGQVMLHITNTSKQLAGC